MNDHWAAGRGAVNTFLHNALDSGGRHVVLEIGSGFNTPGVVRRPVENVVGAIGAARLVRVNRDHPGVPHSIADRSASIGGDAAAFSTATALSQRTA